MTTLSDVEIYDVPGLVKRQIQLKTTRGRAHQFTQYQMTNWPDFGVPDAPAPIVELVKLVRSHDEIALQRILVHCSAGVMI